MLFMHDAGSFMHYKNLLQDKEVHGLYKLAERDINTWLSLHELGN